VLSVLFLPLHDLCIVATVMAFLRSFMNGSIQRLEDLSNSFHEMQIQSSSASHRPPIRRKQRDSNEEQYRDGSPKPGFSPPPAVSASVYKYPQSPQSPVRIVEPIREPEDLLALHREEKAIEQRLQELLDWQAEGLQAGLGAGASPLDDDVLSTGSSTPTLSTRRTSQSLEAQLQPRLQTPRRRKLNLRAARKGISKAILQLSRVKAEEAEVLDGYMEENKEVLQKIEGWTSKKERLEKKIETMEQSNHNARRDELLMEADKVASRIEEVEEELRALKRSHKALLDEATATESAVQSKLASYQESLRLLDQDVQAFLRRPPRATSVSSSKSPFYTLPPKRRTIGLASDHWQEQAQRLEESRANTTTYKQVLEQGAKLWDETVEKVTAFEANLRQVVASLSAVDRKGKQKQTSEKNLSVDAIFKQMNETIVHLEQSHQTATENNWNLLIACIGAELEAFLQAKVILTQAFGIEQPLVEGGSDGDVESNANNLTRESTFGSTDEILAQSMGMTPWHSAMENRTDDKMGDKMEDQQTTRHASSSDDDPDPNLLIAETRDTDTEEELILSRPK
jgi:hypothetical protein